MNDSVRSLSVAPNGDLYAGGGFTTAGGTTVNGIAKWNGSSWTNLGADMDNPAHALSVAPNGDLYAGGDFTTAGGTVANFIAKWNGSTWTNLGSGMNGSVQSLSVAPNGDVYAGGSFTTAGGATVNRIAKWSGSSWTNLSTGVNDIVYGLAQAPNGGVYAAGNFWMAGSLPVNGVAQWGSPIISATGVEPSNGIFAGGYPVTITGTNLCNGILGDVTNVTLYGVTATVTAVNGSTQVVVTAGVAGVTGLGDVRVCSISFGETVKNNAFEYMRAVQAPLVFSPATPQTFGTTNALSVSGGSGTGVVSYAVLSGPGFIFGGTNLVVTNGVGIIQVEALKAQDGLYFVTSVTSGVTAAKAGQTITFPTIADQLTTNRVVLEATATSGLVPAFTVVSGSASISEGTNLTFTGAGSVSVVATQVGDGNWDPAVSVTNTFMVSLTAQAVLSFNPASPQTYATTNVLSASGGSGVGIVSYVVYSGPGTIFGNDSFRSSGVTGSYRPPTGAKLVVNSGTGTVVVVATKAASALYTAQSITGIVECAKAPASVELNGTNQVYSGAARVVTATTTPAGQTVDITYDGTTIAPTNVGTYTVAGIVNEVNYQGGTTGTLTITKATQTINFPNLGQQAVTNKVVLNATATSGLSVTNFSVVSGPAVISNAVNLSFISAGRVTLLATQSGDSKWTAAPAVTNAFDVIGVITNVTPTTGTVFGGTHVTIAGLWLGNGSDITNVTLCNITATIVTQTIHSVTVTAGVSPVGTNADVVVQSTGFGTVTLTNGFTYQPVPSPPIALSAIDVTTNRFTARWTSSDGATNYLLDVSETNTFTSYTSMYNNWNVGDVTACLVTGLHDGTTYYYRLRAANSYGVSTNSNTIEVPVSANTPYIHYEQTNGVASAGSSDVIDVTKLFNGKGMTYMVVGNSNTGLVTTTFVGTNLVLHYTAGQSGPAQITIRVIDEFGFWVETTISVFVAPAPSLVLGPITCNRMIGLFEQIVTVTNNSLTRAAKAVTLTVTSLSVNCVLCNATGRDVSDNPEIQWIGSLPGGASMQFTLQYYNPLRITPSATVLASMSLEDPAAAIHGTPLSISKAAVRVGLANNFLIQFKSVPGRSYYIEYAPALDGPWKTVYPAIVAPANVVQWIDSGPPSTESAPSSVPSRYYHVIEVQ
jgi:hypothetical protein